MPTVVAPLRERRASPKDEARGAIADAPSAVGKAPFEMISPKVKVTAQSASRSNNAAHPSLILENGSDNVGDDGEEVVVETEKEGRRRKTGWEMEKEQEEKG